MQGAPGTSALERGARGEAGAGTLPLREWAALAEAWRITQALRDQRGNRSAAARALGIGRRTLYTKIDRLGLELSWVASGLRPLAGPSRANGALRSTES